jgi:hypothetical protein
MVWHPWIAGHIKATIIVKDLTDEDHLVMKDCCFFGINSMGSFTTARFMPQEKPTRHCN